MLGRLLFVCLLCASASAFAKVDDGPFTVTALPASIGDPTVEAVASGRLDTDFAAYDYREARERGAPFWLRLEPQSGVEIPADAALAVRKGRHLAVRAYDSGTRAGQELMRVGMLPEYRAEQSALYALPVSRPVRDAIYLRVEAPAPAPAPRG